VLARETSVAAIFEPSGSIALARKTKVAPSREFYENLNRAIQRLL